MRPNTVLCLHPEGTAAGAEEAALGPGVDLFRGEFNFRMNCCCLLVFAVCLHKHTQGAFHKETKEKRDRAVT